MKEKEYQFILTGIEQNRIPMENYMKNKFPFLGVQTPERRQQCKLIIKESKQLPLNSLLAMISEIYLRKEREYQYAAIDLAIANVKRLTSAEIIKLSDFVERNAWWDSVDAWRKLFGKYVQFNQDEKENVFTLFYKHPNFWMRRVSILLQLLEKETMDRNLLSKAISYDIDTEEFFIQKAIGWALRDYSKYSPEWTREFIDCYPLSKLAKIEGSKYLDSGL